MRDPSDGRAALREDASPQEIVAALVTQLRGTALNLLLPLAGLGLVIVGVAVQAAAVRDLHDPLAPARVALLAAMVGVEARSTVLLALGHRRVFDVVGGLRRATAAPLTPGWETPFPPPPPAPGELLRQVRALVCAAQYRCDLTYRASFWTVVGIGLLVLWTLANAISGAGG